jgi:PhoH-like ATPase
MAKKTYVLDTSVYLTDASSIHSYGNNDIVIPLKVLEEIDKHKKRQDLVGLNARLTIRTLDNLRQKGNLGNGVRLGKGFGIIRVRGFESLNLPADLDLSIPDHMIVATALSEQNDNPKRKVIAVSNDVNMRVICNALGLQSEDYEPSHVIRERTELYKGHTTVLVDDQFVDQFYDNEKVCLDETGLAQFYPNQFLMLVSNSNEKKSALARYAGQNKPLKKVANFKKGVWNIKARNKEQSFAMDLLMDPAIPIVSLVGKAGSGKTLCAIAAGLQQTLEDITGVAQVYTRLIVSRPVQPLGKDIGFLPGTLEEKMSPWLMPIQDNLQFLMGNDKITLRDYMDRGVVEIEALTYIRGRSISNAYIIIDEAQNLTSHELKTIITRVGEGTKVILTGDIEQIDSVYIDEFSNGLTYAVEKLKAHDISGHITLQKGERSKVATLASRVL